ncbi:hypothetical protein EXIGLDRAFT_749515 [Exidia glandulosa HHB12029]|uniref:Borealin N-terminal domain-containing protein n=1 Tax=Exidia glandulosa HHB12029 TaxID=1314781 RepID=A0A165I061_EXIGL|nr:hypothetical protein EXIGLDRAFT_749515 [Exidia glandulosa HHB12029]
MMASTPPQTTQVPVTLSAGPRRIYTAEEKRHMLTNLELEVSDRQHKFQKQISEMVAAFVVRSENEVVKVPRAIRNMLLEDFAKYGGDVKRALHGLAKDRLDAIPDATVNVPMSVKKRKWHEGSQDDGPSTAALGPRASKAARTYTSPTKLVPLKKASTTSTLGNAGRTPKTPRIIRPGHLGSIPSPMMANKARAPSTAHFNPLLPKTPAYPAKTGPVKIDMSKSAVLRRKPSFMVGGAAKSDSGDRGAVALVSVPTKDGQVIELDPLSASPSTIDALEGISDSAKKQAKDEMARLVHGALAKWSIA